MMNIKTQFEGLHLMLVQKEMTRYRSFENHRKVIVTVKMFTLNNAIVLTIQTNLTHWKH